MVTGQVEHDVLCHRLLGERCLDVPGGGFFDVPGGGCFVTQVGCSFVIWMKDETAGREMVCVVNPNVATRRGSEAGVLRTELNVWSLGMTTDSTVIVDEANELGEDDDDAGPPQPGARVWAHLRLDPRLDAHLAHSLDALQAQRFHSGLHS
jgi:hypothetical protein